MAKLTRAKLKGIIKECLVEILSEGLGNTDPTAAVLKSGNVEQQLVRSNKSARKKNNNFESALNETVSSITDDDIMREIFEDTAKNTLQEQAAHGRQSSPHSVGDSPAGIDLAGIFDSAKQNWSDLAFAENKSKIAE